MNSIPILDLSGEVDSLWTELNEAIQKVLRHGSFIMGPEVKAFEDQCAKYLGVKHAIGVNSGTDALVIGLRALRIGQGDEVITTPFTFFATAESISSVGATPIFADIDEATFNIDPSQIETMITPRTKAIMPVHLYGNPCAMTEIQAIAKKHGLKVIEDCAQSFGARTSAGQQMGSIGDVGAFSFFPSKNLGAYGDGGMITTNDDSVADLARMLRVHGSKKKYFNEILGYNSRLDTIQAAILGVKLPHIDRWNRARYDVAVRYNNMLEGLSGVRAPVAPKGRVFHQYTVRIFDGKRDQVQSRLADQGIGTMIYYPVPQDRLPIYSGKYPSLPTSDRLSKEVLSLPIWPGISVEQQEAVVTALRSAVSA